MTPPWPLVGRTAELACVREMVARREPGVIFVGSAGVGKTRVAREAVAAARAARRPTLWVSVTRAAASIPLGALAAALPSASMGGPSSSRLVAHAVTAVESRFGAQRGLLCVDDAHLLDGVSAAVLHQLAERNAMTLLITMRAGPATDAVTSLWKDGLLDRVELSGLDEQAMAELLRSALDGPVETVSAKRLLALSDGNVLLLRHLVEGELAAGRLVNDNSCWYWRSEGVPKRIGDLLTAQLGAVQSDERDVLDLLAIAEPLPLTVLDGVTGRAAAARAEAAGLIMLDAEGGDDAVRLAHPLYAEVLRDQLRPLRARALRTALVDALSLVARDTATDGGRHWSLRRCMLALDSDASVHAADLHAAAGTAMSLLDEPLAERLCRAALARSPSFDSRLRLGYSLIRQERTAEGAAVLRELAASASEADLAVAMRPIAASLFWDDDDPDQAQSVLSHTRAMLDSGAARAQIDALQSSFAAFLARPAEALRLAEAVLARHDVTGEATAWACAGATMALAATGQVRRVDQLARRGWMAAVASDTERFLLLPLTNGAVLAYGRAGELATVAAMIDRFEQVSAGLPNAQARSALLLFRGQLAWWRGDLPAATRLLEDAAFGFGDPPGAPACWAVQCLLWAVAAHAASGDSAAARRALERLERHGRAAMTIFDTDVELAYASMASADGLVAEAIRRAHRAADMARSRGLYAAEVEALHRAVRWGDVSSEPRLRELAGVEHAPAPIGVHGGSPVQGPRAPLTAQQASALAAGDTDALITAGDGWSDLGSPVLAAEAYAQAAAVRTSRSAAITGPHAARARHLAERHHARTPALLTILNRGRSAARLTRREREVASLAATGLSNAEIAARLVLSIRTVEGHLLQAYDKLGVHDRRALAQAWTTSP